MTGSPFPSPTFDRSGHLPERIGPFGIQGVLGRGGMGVVFDAVDPQGRRVALKVIRPLGDAERARSMTARFLREAKILGQLNHPGVVRLIDFGDADGVLFLAMERIEGVSLLSVRRSGPLGFEPLVELGALLSDALDHMHAGGVVHRDIKPANILIDTSGRPIITDFGISGLSDATGITQQGDLLGSPGFMAPEVVEGAPPTPRSDQFSLGRLLFELGALGAAKRLPKRAPILEVLAIAMEVEWHRFPTGARWGELETQLRRMLSTRPADRFPDSAAVTRALQTLSGADVLDSETLSEHVERLDLPASTSWEVLSDDLDLPAPRGDELMLNLDRPAGERPAEASQPTSPAPPAVPPFPSGTFQSDHADTRIVGPRDPKARPDPTIPLPGGPTSVAPADRRSKSPPDLGPPGEGRPPRTDARSSGPKNDLAPFGEGRPPSGPRADPRSSGPKNDLAPAGASDGGADAARADQSPLGALGDLAPFSDGPEPVELQIPRMERQIGRLRDELAASRKQTDAARPKRLVSLGLALVALAAGFAGGAYWAAQPSPPPTLVLVPSNTELVMPRHQLAVGKMPTAQDQADAHQMLQAAQEHLANRDLDAAERLLGLCIEIADLPDCHKTVATIYALTQNPAARAHFEHYLNVAPTAPDAERIRKVLAH